MIQGRRETPDKKTPNGILTIVVALPETVGLVIYGEVRIICHVVDLSGFIDYAAGGGVRVFLLFEGCDWNPYKAGILH